MNIICGKTLALKRRSLLNSKITEFKNIKLRPPKLSVILVGNYPPSEVYVKAKQQACESVGIDSEVIRIEESNFENTLKKTIESLNKNNLVDGILLQLPLPNKADSFEYLSLIDPIKDVDGLSPYNLGCLFSGKPIHIPCTPLGIMNMLQEIEINLESKNVVIFGRSLLVGKPLSLLMKQANASVTVVHSKTINPEKISKQADILICAIGKPEYINANFVKSGSVVIDVGITNINGKLKGDVNFENIKNLVGSITPVPGGVGPMTVTTLLENTVKAAYLKIKKSSIKPDFSINN